MVSCLAQLLLDPQTRTRAGFERLVQREWVLLGHPFQERIGLVQAPEGKKVRGRATALGGREVGSSGLAVVRRSGMGGGRVVDGWWLVVGLTTGVGVGVH